MVMAGMIQRQLPDLLLGLFRLMEPLGGKTDIVFGQSHAGIGQANGMRKGGCGNMINMLNDSRSNRIGLCCGAKVIAVSRNSCERLKIDWRGKNPDGSTRRAGPARADAGILPLAADVAVARARGGDAAVPSLAARSRPDRAAMADSARAGRRRRHRGHGTRAGRISAGPEPFADFARSRGASTDRTRSGEGRSAPRRGVDFGKGIEADRAVAPTSEAIYAAITQRYGARKLGELQDMLHALEDSLASASRATARLTNPGERKFA